MNSVSISLSEKFFSLERTLDIAHFRDRAVIAGALARIYGHAVCNARAHDAQCVLSRGSSRPAREFRVISIPRRRSPVNSGLVLPSAVAGVYNSRGDKIRRVVVDCVV